MKSNICLEKARNSNFHMIFLKKKISRKRLFIALAIVSIWVLAIIFLAKSNVTNPNFWFDETGQFWIAKGLNHYSPQFSPDGTISDVLKNNSVFNLDPGGFSLILNFWTFLSNNHTFIRSLPFIFFILGMIVVTKLCLVWQPRNYLAYFGGFILLSSALLKEYAFELRPYSMEMLAAILSLYFCYQIPRILSEYKYALFSGFVLAVFLSSRYSALFSITSLGIILLATLLYKYFNKQSIVNFFLFALPIIVSALGIYIFTLRYQNPTGIPPTYVAELMFKTNSVSKILFNQPVLITVLPFLLLTLIFLLSIKIRFFRNLSNPYRQYFLFALLLNLIFILLSIMGKYPWGINSRWDISTHAIFVIAWLPLVFMLSDLLCKKEFLSFKYARIILVPFFVLYFLNNAYNFHYSSLDSAYTNYISNNISPNSKILINVGAYPTIRYQFEYGMLGQYKNDGVYKNISMFNHAEYTNKNSIENLDNIDKYNYIILTHFDFPNSDMKNILSQKPNWVDVSVQGPSKLFKNTKVE